jgi:succinyl-CoA synthetase beta subunit
MPFRKNNAVVENLAKELYKYTVRVISLLGNQSFHIQRDGAVIPLDFCCRVDDTGACKAKNVGNIDSVFFRPEITKKKSIFVKWTSSDRRKLKAYNLNTRRQNMKYGSRGGASVIYADTVCDLGFSKELANYGEYSAIPSTEFTYLYAKTILDLMTTNKTSAGKV